MHLFSVMNDVSCPNWIVFVEDKVSESSKDR